MILLPRVERVTRALSARAWAFDTLSEMSCSLETVGTLSTRALETPRVPAGISIALRALCWRNGDPSRYYRGSLLGELARNTQHLRVLCDPFEVPNLLLVREIAIDPFAFELNGLREPDFWL